MEVFIILSLILRFDDNFLLFLLEFVLVVFEVNFGVLSVFVGIFFVLVVWELLLSISVFLVDLFFVLMILVLDVEVRGFDVVGLVEGVVDLVLVDDVVVVG